MDEHEILKARLEAKFAPWRIRTTLTFAGLYQLAHELIRTSVIDDVRLFYVNTLFTPVSKEDKEERAREEERYAWEVLYLHPKGHEFPASLAWLVNAHAITQAQANHLRRIGAHRNDLTHELLKYLVDPRFEPNVMLLKDAVEILVAIRLFWIEMEIAKGSFEEFGNVSVEDVSSPMITVLQMCIDAYIEGFTIEQEHMLKLDQDKATEGTDRRDGNSR